MGFLAKIRRGFGRTFSFFSESWTELTKVRWPNRKELTSYTIVVLVTVTLITIYFAIIDLGISELLRMLFE